MWNNRNAPAIFRKPVFIGVFRFIVAKSEQMNSMLIAEMPDFVKGAYLIPFIRWIGDTVR